MNLGLVLSEFKINYLAVGVAAAVPILIGALWYFGIHRCCLVVTGRAPMGTRKSGYGSWLADP